MGVDPGGDGLAGIGACGGEAIGRFEEEEEVPQAIASSLCGWIVFVQTSWGKMVEGGRRGVVDGR